MDSQVPDNVSPLKTTRLLDLIDFVKETTLLRNQVCSDVTKHGGFLVCEEDLYHSETLLPGVTLDTEDAWITVERLSQTLSPELESELDRVTILRSHQPEKPPSLRKTMDVELLSPLGLVPSEAVALVKSEGQIPIEALDQGTKEKIDQNFSEYCLKWEEWRKEEIPRRQSIAIYSQMFNCRQEEQGAVSGRQIEIVLGIGVLDWNVDSQDFNYPLLTLPVEIDLDTETMLISVRPTEREPRVEMEFFRESGIQGFSDYKNSAKEFEEDFRDQTTVSPFDPSTYERLLRAAASTIDRAGKFVERGSRDQESESNSLVVKDEWLCFSRPRSSGPFVDDLNRFREVFKSDVEEIPQAISAVVTEPQETTSEPRFSNFRGLSLPGDDTLGVVEDLFFPLPFNDEQVRIVQYLESHEGVVVQGPPGTGKTHTIANIICHYLATGKRVLVTSMKEPALSVLRDKLPEEIQPLAVSLLTNEKEGSKRFQFAIEKIASIIDQTNPTESEKLIKETTGTIDLLHSQIVGLEKQISRWANDNLSPFKLDEELIHPEIAAREISESEVDVSWLGSNLSIAPEHEPQFTDADIEVLRKLRIELGDDLVYLPNGLPPEKDIPSAVEVEHAHRNLLELGDLNEEFKKDTYLKLRRQGNEIDAQMHELFTQVEEYTQIQEFLSEDDGEVCELFIEVAESASKDEELVRFCDVSTKIREQLKVELEFLEEPIRIPIDFEHEDSLIEPLERASTGKSFFGILGFVGKAREKELLGKTRIMEKSPTSESDWLKVLKYVSHRKKLRSLVIQWNAVAGAIGLGLLDIQSKSAREAERLFAIYKKVTESANLEAKIRKACKELFSTDVFRSEESIGSIELKRLSNSLRAYQQAENLAESKAMSSSIKRIEASYSGPVFEKVKSFLDSNFGKNRQFVAEDLWLEITNELNRLRSKEDSFNKVEAICEKIRSSGADLWAQKLTQMPCDGSTDPLTPFDWSKYWRISRISNYIKSIDRGNKLAETLKERQKLEELLGKKYEELVKHKTHLQLFINSNDATKSALQAFKAAIKRMPKSATAKTAPIYRRQARESARKADSSIPCWIMPHYRVSESLPARLGAFDLVVIDEASQSDLTALPSLFRAKKVLVVGDDRQVSPDSIGITVEKAQTLKRDYLGNQVELFKDQLNMDGSIYDLFKVVFAKAGITLREHFRCAEPIIEYSKREFYDNMLVPLRTPTLTERLEPQLIDVYVTDGFRKNDKNQAEIEFIVQEIRKIVEDPKMEGRTIGVVSLQGRVQAKAIFEALEREIGFEKIERYAIKCGDASKFQGDERDIMFLSMMVSKNGDKGYKAVSGTRFEQRYNVSATRAKDRMYLVRSVSLDDLSSADGLREALIKHFQTPFQTSPTVVAEQRELCESEFEKDFFDELTSRGFRVTPQVRSGPYRIDMVVEGTESRLAVECDGDQYHPPEKWQDDMRRQRVLERVGWKFWRCFASSFYSNREGVLEDLLGTLNKMGIEPLGIEGSSQSNFLTSFEWSYAEHQSESVLEPIGDEIDKAFANLSQ